MLTILYPQLAAYIKDLPLGLWPVTIADGTESKLLIKATKEVLLAAKVNNGFKVYVCPVSLGSRETVGLISAFFDDADEPLAIFTPLFEEEPVRNLIEMLRQPSLDIHLFDEHSRELLGYSCQFTCPARTKNRLTDASLCSFEFDSARSALFQLQTWFGMRSHEDDLSAISIEFTEALIPDDLLIMDARPDSHLNPGGPSMSFSRLERPEPGAFQEQDIAKLLARLFSPKHILMNPLRVTDNEEIADILVVTESEIIILQAKDSPNTERVLRNTIERKKATTQKALLKAIGQVKGAIRYLRSTSPAKMIVGQDSLEIDISKHQMRALVVVRELFNDEYGTYSPPLLEVSNETKVPSIALDYPELQAFSNLSGERKFFEAIDLVFSHGVKTGEFPRLRIWNSGDAPS